MRQNFEQCMEWLLAHEGGYVDHPKDPGGATNLGVTKKVWEQWVGKTVSKQDIKELTPKEVLPLYKKKYWDTVRGDDLPSGVDWAVFDWGVNSGPARAAKALQRAAGVNQDGVIGPKTLQQVFNFEPKQLIHAIYQERQHFYEALTTFRTFGKGWTKRNQHTYQQAIMLAGVNHG